MRRVFFCFWLSTMHFYDMLRLEKDGVFFYRRGGFLWNTEHWAKQA